MTLLYDGVSGKQEKGDLGFCPLLISANVLYLNVAMCANVVLIILSTQYFEAIDLLRLKKIQYME